MKIEFTNRCRTAAIGLAALFALAAAPALAAVTKTELAGHSITPYPHFEYVKAINENSGVQVAIDPTRFPAIGGQTCDIYVVAAKSTVQWNTNPSLTDITTGGAQTALFSAVNIQANTFTVTAPFELNGNAGTDLGVGYDVVLDCNQDGVLNGNDYIDGRNNESGFYVVHDTTAPGPLAVTHTAYNLSGAVGATYGLPGTHLAQDLFYPSGIVGMGQLPLIVISHGNGHNYAWYDHIGNHLASYGYIVMSHANNTAPGPVSASTTTLGHTDAFIDQVAAGVIAGGMLTGHLDADRIVWIGHSRGGEGVAIAYDRMFDATYVPVNYVMADIKLISSMLPTDFNGPNVANPHNANYHLWTASGDSDVNGSAGCDLCQTYHLHDRATGHRQSTTVQGTGHAWFHNYSGGLPWFTGPCSIGPTNSLTHLIQLGHLLPLVKRYVDDNIPSLDFLTRQYESFRPIGVPTGNSCIVVTHEYLDASVGAQKTVMIDDYQSQFGTGTSSIGAGVTFDVSNVTENRLDDNNSDFLWTAADPFNGATQAGPLDTSRGVVFDWTGANRFYQWAIPVAEQDFTDNLFLSFRGAQGTQHPNTAAVLGDLTFDVTLVDGSSNTSSINIGAFGGGLEEPYQRSGGWHNEMETIRIRLTDFLNNGSGLDLTDIVAVRLDVGPAHGSAEGRIVIDDVMLTNDRAVYDAGTNGDPHIKTVDGTHYDFQSAGEFTLLQDGSTMEIQARQTPVSGAPPIPNAHTGLKSCVSLNTAVAARVGGHRVSFQPNISGTPDPSGMQLRINGVLTDINAVQSVNLGSGGRVAKAPAGNGIEIDFPNGTSLIASPHWWNSQSKWYLNLSVFKTPATEGVMGLVQAGWLPALPDGSSLGSKPASLAQRYIDLNQTFADAWRITDAGSLFDYAPGTSTKTFTNREWPPEESEPCIVPDSPPVTPMDWDRALEACRGIIDADNRNNCAFDVAATGEFGFVEAWLLTQKIDLESTRTDVYVKQDRDAVTLTAVVRMKKAGAKISLQKGQSPGTVQFTLDGKAMEPVYLDSNGQATWTTRIGAGKHAAAAAFSPNRELPLLPSASLDKQFVIEGK